MSFNDDNGGEPLRFSTSESSGCEFQCVVRKCIFQELNSDPETISIKTARVTVEDNYFISNASNVTVRHGGLATIQHNYFDGYGGSERNGVRLHGYHNIVTYNCFNKVDVPVMLRYGNATKDPNWKDVKTPSGKRGTSHAAYAQTVNNLVNNNEFRGTKYEVRVIKKSGTTLAPKDTVLKNNKPVEKFGFEQTVDVTPPTPPVEPPTPPTPPDVPPEPEFLTCQVDGVKDATVKEEKYVLCAADKAKVDIALISTPSPTVTGDEATTITS